MRGRILTVSTIMVLVAAILTTGCDSPAKKYYKEASRHEDRGDYEAAIASLNKSVAADAGYVRAYAKIGEIYLDRADYARAQEHLEKAIEVDPDYAKSYRRLSKTYRYQGKFAEALSTCQKALERPAVRRDTKEKARLEEEISKIKEEQQKAENPEPDKTDASKTIETD